MIKYLVALGIALIMTGESKGRAGWVFRECIDP